jgi:uncharacterized protein YjiS (DUF1127 family)
MSAIQWQQPRYRGGQQAAIGVLNDVGHHVTSTLREWRRRARERAELAALDDRTLKDIGLTRADAEFLANKPFWRE